MASALASASPANADPGTYREWTTQCTTGAFQACFSLSVQFVHGLVGNEAVTHVEIHFANLQGQYDWLPNSGAWYPAALGLSNLSATNVVPHNLAGLSVVTPEGGAGPAFPPPAQANYPQWYAPYPPYNAGEAPLTLLYTDSDAPVWGCDADMTLSNGYGGWQTCTGDLRLNFTTWGDWDFTDNTTANILGAGVNGTGRTSFVCDQIGQCTTTVTPEPLSMVLLGTGLAGLGGVGLLRRRRRPFEGST